MRRAFVSSTCMYSGFHIVTACPFQARRLKDSSPTFETITRHLSSGALAEALTRPLRAVHYCGFRRHRFFSAVWLRVEVNTDALVPEQHLMTFISGHDIEGRKVCMVRSLWQLAVFCMSSLCVHWS